VTLCVPLPLACAVLLQRVVWGRRFDPRVYLSLLPVVGGIVLTSVTELSFVWAGFLAALFGCFVTSTKVRSGCPGVKK